MYSVAGAWPSLMRVAGIVKLSGQNGEQALATCLAAILEYWQEMPLYAA